MTKKIAEKKITKKQFLVVILAAMAAFSMGGMLNLFRKEKASASTGYGASRYGM